MGVLLTYPQPFAFNQGFPAALAYAFVTFEEMTIDTHEIDPRIAGNFKNFLYLVWQQLSLPKPTPVQYDIADYLQHGPKRKMVQAFRGVGKSWITSALVCWLLYRDPQTKILVVSASKTRADDFSTFTKRLIAEMPMLQHLRAREGQRDSNVAFDVGPAQASHAPSVKSVGITGQMTGSRADVIIADDIESANNSLTQIMRDKLLSIVKEFDAVLTPKPSSQIIYLGTPQSEMSIYNTLPERGYELRIWPARYPQQKYMTMYGEKLAPFILKKLEEDPSLSKNIFGRGSPVDPDRFGDQDLVEREASYGRSGFALQFMLDTSLSDADKYPLKLSDYIVLDSDREVGPVKVTWAGGPDQNLIQLPMAGLAGDKWNKPLFISKEFEKYQGIVMAIDPSGRGSDETAYAVVAMLNGYLFLLESGGFKGGYEDSTLESLAKTAQRNKVSWIITENNFGDGMFDKLLAPWLIRVGYPCTIDPDGYRATQQKEKRIIDILEPVLNQHRLVVDTKVITEDLKVADPRNQLFYQLSRITKERGALVKDDRVDVLSIAVNYWTEQMDKDVTKNIDQHREKMLDMELEKFMENALGVTSGSTKW